MVTVGKPRGRGEKVGAEGVLGTEMSPMRAAAARYVKPFGRTGDACVAVAEVEESTNAVRGITASRGEDPERVLGSDAVLESSCIAVLK